jgi:hypothetical protein
MNLAHASDLILTGAKPDRLFIIDAASRSVRTEHRVAGAEANFYHYLVAGPAHRVLVGGSHGPRGRHQP